MSDDEDNPIDTLILKKAEDRAARKRAVAENGALEGSSEATPTEDSAADRSDGRKRKRKKKSATITATEQVEAITQQAAFTAVQAPNGNADTSQHAAPPIGVVVLEDGDPEPNYEMQKLLRAPRYFDQVYEPKGVACWRCGKRGHLAKDCTLSEAKPCVYCAQYGHESRDCPHRICYRCGAPGHMTKDCTQRSGTASGSGACMRCGRANCAAADYLDWFRYEGGCDQDYYSSDLDMVRCFVCGEKGHLSCQPAPLTAPKPSCWNCGGSHWAEECPQEYPSHLMAERLQDRDRQKQQRVQQEQWQMLQAQRQQLAMQQLAMQQQAGARWQQQPAQPQWQQPWGGQQQWIGQGGLPGQGSWQQQRQQFQQQPGWQHQQQQQGGWQGHQQQPGYQQQGRRQGQQQGGWQGQQRWQQQQDDFPRGHGGSGSGGSRKTWR